ncbi:hypothetical protein FQA39_LY19191 [Lamprigera yunnana]|nr:hypothetical protein FQA39_LY19191 [Lamprigera yunnana]
MKAIHLYSECYFRGMGYIDNNIIYSKLKRTRYYLHYLQQSAHIIDKCTSTNGNTVGEKVSILMKCSMKEMDKVWRDKHNNPGRHIQQRAIKTCTQRNNVSFLKLEEYFKILPANGQMIQVISESYLLELNFLNSEDYIDAASKCDYQLQLYSKCYLTELGYIDRTARIQYDNIKNISAPDISFKQYSNWADLCKKEVADTITETPHKFSKCFLFNIHKLHTNMNSNLTHTEGRQATETSAKRYSHPIQNFGDCSRVLGYRGLRDILFSQCYLRGIACLRSNNTILYEKVKEFTPPGVSRNVYSDSVDFCKTTKVRGTTDASYAFLRCPQSYAYTRTTRKSVQQNFSPQPKSQSTSQPRSRNKTDEEDDNEQEKQPKGKNLWMLILESLK